LEHIENPVPLLIQIKNIIRNNGVFVISVPNAQALSRQLAVKMGLLSSIYELTDNDKHHGHYRVYDWVMLENEIIESGLEIIGRHGLSFKLFSDKQNIEMLKNQIIGKDQIRGLWQLGDEFIDFSGAIMIVAKVKY
jgi:2-polyprenyl-3-methyl-5-hydroxy-6-metoxy-1,4-benzoquinol methylase